MDQRSTQPVKTRCRGQIAPVALFGVLIASAALVMMFNTGQKVTEKSLVANAADAAAYSGAVWTARHLNFMAYTNRAMVANHAAVGHFVSYVSWIRYIHDSIEYVDQFTQFIPYIGQYIDYVERVVEEVREATEETAQFAVPAIDLLNDNFRAAQVEAHASLALENLHQLMNATARTYDVDIRVNERSELEALPDELRALLESQLLAQLAAAPTFIARYTASDDRGAVRELISASLSANTNLRRWIPGERGWRETLPTRQIRKLGGTTNRQDVYGADWNASDQLQHRSRQLFGWGRWRRVGSQVSTAAASEFDADYSGVPSYYNVAGGPGDQVLRIAAIATKRQTDVRTADLLGMTANARPLAVAAVARVEFRRPGGAAFAALAANRREYSHLFNPFWEAKLAPVDLGGAP